MQASVPRDCVEDRVVFRVASSRGGDPYPVQVFPQTDAVICPCIGYKNHGHCRHATGVRAWLTGVIPPSSLPE